MRGVVDAFIPYFLGVWFICLMTFFSLKMKGGSRKITILELSPCFVGLSISYGFIVDWWACQGGKIICVCVSFASYMTHL
jgi:hypothetical protein